MKNPKVRMLRDDALPSEAYRLAIHQRRGVTISFSDEAGRDYALHTLNQMTAEGTVHELQCCEIYDYPRFPYRGLHVDVSRHFRSVDFLKKQIDAMAMFKMNRMHIHLTDAAGWRLQIDAYPRLTQFAAWRPQHTWKEWWAGDRHYAEEGSKGAYGGYYTKEEIRDLVSYARARHIEIIPEIEMPSHSEEVLAAYPELGCSGEAYQDSDFCVGNEEVFNFLETVLDEVMEVFPSEYIHIGGDEAGKQHWKTCPKCQKRMQEEGMKHKNQLQGYLVRHIEQFLRERGKTVIGWDEIVETGLPEQAVVMSWRGTPGGVKASAEGHDVIMSPNSYVYLDYYQDLIRKEPKAVGHMQSLRHVYKYDPLEGIDPEFHHHILGLQGNLWCELIPYAAHAEYMLYPRAFAIAEIGWTPQEKREFFHFRERCLTLITIFRNMGYNTFDLFNESLRAQTGRLRFDDPTFKLL